MSRRSSLRLPGFGEGAKPGRRPRAGYSLDIIRRRAFNAGAITRRGTMNRPDDDRHSPDMTERRALLIGLLALPAVAGATHAAAAEPTAAGTVTPADPGLYNGRIDGFRDKTLAQRVQELIDREEYRELTATYALRVAHGVSTADLFTDDGVFTVETPGRALTVSGGSRAALDKNMANTAAMPDKPLPQIHNYLIRVNGNTAQAICSNELRRSENGKSMIGSGWYHDELRREDGRWRFVRRDMRFRHYVPIQQGWATSPS
jgi:hypothetical protein